MAPSQKRKRGRPPKQPREDALPVTDDERPSKRGKVIEGETPSSQSQMRGRPPRKSLIEVRLRGRERGKDEKERAQEQLEAEQQQQQREKEKHQRELKEQQEKQRRELEEQQQRELEQQQRKKRGKQKRQQQQQEQQSKREQQQSKREQQHSKREKQQKDKQQEENPQPSVAEDTQPPRRRGRSSRQKRPSEQGVEIAPRQTRGQPPPPTPDDEVPTKRRKRERPSLQRQPSLPSPPPPPPPPPPPKPDSENQQSRPKKRRRVRQGHEPEADADEDESQPRRWQKDDSQPQRSQNDEEVTTTAVAPTSSSLKPYPRVVSHVRHVRQSIISAKWTPLMAPSLAVVKTLLTLAQQPILQHLSGANRRRAYASDILRIMSRRISRKVSRGLPFPPALMPAPARGQQQSDGGRETELDFESVLDAKAVLEAQLEPAAHSVEILRREKQRVEKELERDYEALKALELAARAQAREHRGLLKKAHLLAPQKGTPHETRLVVSPASAPPDDVFTDLENQDVTQLADHVDSIRVNMQQVEGLVPHLARGRAALQAVLLSHLSVDQYERVVLG